MKIDRTIHGKNVAFSPSIAGRKQARVEPGCQRESSDLEQKVFNYHFHCESGQKSILPFCGCMRDQEALHELTTRWPRQRPQPPIFTQKFLVKSESTLIFLSKNLSFERKITTNFDSRQKYPFGTNIEFYRKCIYLQLMPIQWHELSRIMVKMWYFVGFQPSKCRNTHIQPQI